MSEFKKERDENGVAYYEVVDDNGNALMLMASRHPVDNYRLHRDGPPWEELASLYSYFAGDPTHTFYRLTLAQARDLAHRFGGELITEAQLNPGGKAYPEPEYDPSDGPLPAARA